MKKFYYLSTCDTCTRIKKALNLGADVALREIKSKPLTLEEIDNLAQKAGSYEAIFSKRARKYRAFGLDEQDLKEEDYRRYLEIDYTFLKRPLLETEEEVIAGNSEKVVGRMRAITSA